MAAEHDNLIDQYLEELFGMCDPSVKQSELHELKRVSHQISGDPFENLYLITDEEEQSLAKKAKVNTLGIELPEFGDTRVPMKDPTEFWRYSQLKRLRTCAKIIFSVQVSSASVERLFSQAGILLSKMRKRVSPAVMKKLVYIRYQNKYKELINKLGIVIDPGELEKAIDEDREKKAFETDVESDSDET